MLTPSNITKVVCSQANVNLQLQIMMVTKPKSANGAQASIKVRKGKWFVFITGESEH